MSLEGSSTPRRALGPLPDDAPESSIGGRFAHPALSPDDPSPTSTGRLRRLAASPLSPDDPLEVEPTTPVPPPAPVLPDPEGALPPTSGRRFSASTEPREVVSAAPRRSAVTATSPWSPDEQLPPPPVRPTLPPPMTTPAAPIPATPAPVTAAITSFSQFPQSVPTASTAPLDAPTMIRPPEAAEPPPAEPADADQTPQPKRRGNRRDRAAKEKKGAAPPQPGKPAKPTKPAKAAKPDKAPPGPTSTDAGARPAKRSSRPALIIIASVAAVALLVSGAVWLLTLRSTAPSGAPTDAGLTSALDPLLTAADLGTLGGVDWVDPAGDGDGVRPLCLPANGDGLPSAQRTEARRIGASTSEVDAVVQVVETYPDDATASRAYAVREAQAGTCPDTLAWITGASQITGLADTAEAVRLTVQEEQDQFHTLLITRTGRTVSMIDVLTTDGSVSPSDLAVAAAKPLSRLCGGEQGTCPGSIEVANNLPAASNLRGWLVEADLPRITPGAGRWGATDPAAVLSVVGSQCEAVDLRAIAGTSATGQRTFLLADDAQAPAGFGVDQAVYTFASSNLATKLAKKLAKNLSGCADRAPTAKVDEGPRVKTTGANGEAITGSTYLVTQKTETSTMVYRVAVVTIDDQVCYLLANAGTSFDFNDDQWRRIAVRAGQRVSQG